MGYDGITMYLVKEELHDLLAGARVDKIYQPHPLEIVLYLRARDSAHYLICSAHSRHARVHLSAQKPENPAVPPAFCMLLRKHLSGARLLSVEQSGLERILTFIFRSYDEFGNMTKKSLVCELMGKHSNLILTMPYSQTDAMILGSIKTVDESMSRYRIVMPQETYYPPPAQGKLDLFSLTEESLASAMAEHETGKPENILVSSVMGIGKELAHEVIERINGEALHPLETVRPLFLSLRKLISSIKDNTVTPVVKKSGSGDMRFLLFHPQQGDRTDIQPFATINEALDYYYTNLLQQETLKQEKGRLEQILSVAVSRTEKKLRLQQSELAEMGNADKYRMRGELITANLHMLKIGMKVASVPNYYSETAEKIDIPLYPALSPQDNAQHNFKKYRKLRDGKHYLLARAEETSHELNYLDSLLVCVRCADELLTLAEIRAEMESAGLIRSKPTKKTTENLPSAPQHFLSPDGIDIYVGKNNRQNDLLTMRMADKEDTWLHVKDIPGSHVIVKAANPPDATLLFAAGLAARYSKAAASANVPVDVTKVKHVKKPKAAKPGMVIYTNQKTIYVTP